MATIPAASAPNKLSFAKVVASGPKENTPPDPRSRAAPASQSAAPTSPQPAATKGPVMDTPDASDPVAKTPVANQASLVQSMNDLNVSSTAVSATSTPSLVVNGSAPMLEQSRSKTDNTHSISDDTSQRADSNSEMGNYKAPSLDGKSITSGTTFALDEKESLRPDDSASVKAADDDEAFSIRSSMVANGRIGSDVARVHRLRIGDMPERKIVHIIQENGIATPQSGASSQQPPVETPQTLGTVGGSTDGLNSMYSQNPDEKLLEAMQSPKDRIFLLRLEQDVINFVQSSKEPYMDLPPNNSFCRMLTHKLADYYHMTHSFEAVQGSVRIFRTPFCRVPPSLASIAGNNGNSSTETPPPSVLPKKIMRRGEDSGHASGSLSKATSEDGSDKDKARAKEKLTREEKQEAYNKARVRIFGSEDKFADSNENEDANGVSRASSVSGRDKSTLGKRGKTGKQRRDDSESFDSRSQYTAYYPHPQQPTWAPQYVPVGQSQYNPQMQQPYPPNAMAQGYGPPQNPYPPMMPNNGYPQYGNIPVYPPQPQPQPTPSRYTPSNSSMGGSYGSPMAAPVAPQPWQQPSFNPAPSPGTFQPCGPQPQPQPQMQPQMQPQIQPPQMPPQTQPQNNMVGNGSAQGPVGVGGIPYAFGQLPVNVNPHDPKSQHPIPGSYNRHAFNPKTQSFVPGNGMNPMPGTPYMGGPHGSPQIGSPHLAHSNYSSPAPSQAYMGGASYGMSRQGSNNSMTAYYPPPHIAQHTSPHIGHMPPHMPNKPGMPPIPQGPPPPAGPGQAYSHLPNYGNPATLPQKPPPGI